MELEKRIDLLDRLSRYIIDELEGELQPLISKSIIENPWYTPDSVSHALRSVSSNYLAREKIQKWIESCDSELSESLDHPLKRVGLVLAGNIPMVGLHDILSVFVSGHHAVIKYSHKDKVLIPHLLGKLAEWDDEAGSSFTKVERLSEIDAVIATGGNTAATHFKAYFGKYPHIIRKNRSSVAVLHGDETKEELNELGGDIFTYFGLGCRNVSKVYAPEGYVWDEFYESIYDFSFVGDHHKYKNNYDYTHAIYLLGQHPFLTNNFLILREEKSMTSRISCVHYESYDDLAKVDADLVDKKEDIQCIASNKAIGTHDVLRLGTCQNPELWDYADGVDTLAFLSSLS